jgi:hypothetical protein
MKFCPFSSIKFPFIHSSTENSQMILHVCSSMIFGWLVQKEKIMNELHFMDEISWMDFHYTSFIKIDTKNTWYVNSKPFNLLSLC